MDANLDTLATALYVKTDDVLKTYPERLPARPRIGITPKISDAELVTLAVMQSLLGYTSERRWLRYARVNLLGMFPDLPGQSGDNKRLRKLADTMAPLVSMLGADTQIADDDVWVVDSTPVECGRSRETAKRSDLARMGRIRLLRLPLQILVGAAPAPGLHPASPAVGLGSHGSHSRRTSRTTRHAGQHEQQTDPDRRQQLLRGRVRGPTGRRWH